MKLQTEMYPSNQDAMDFVQQRESANRLTEMYVWMIASLVIAGGIFFDIFTPETSPVAVIRARYFELLFAVFTFLFPWVYRLIFGALPLEAIRQKRALCKLEEPDRATAARRNDEVRDAEIRVFSDAMSAEEMAGSSATNLFAHYASNSRRLSQSIYSRAGVYLLVGVVVAFSGLAFFYSQTAHLGLVAPENMSVLIELAPKFGILFFVEMVAFFFLRQYRSAMDEFRYYEAIKRKREETLALIRIASDMGKEFDIIDLVKSESFFSRDGSMDKGQSTEALEFRTLEKGELELLDKVIDAVSRGRA